MHFNIDITIITSFLIINILAGIYSGRGIATLKHYAIGNRNFSTATITATIIATWIGAGSFSSSISETYQNGLWHIVARIGDSLTLLIVGVIIAPRIGEFFGKLTVAEIMNSLYGKKIRIITAISSMALSTGYVAVQIKVFSILFSYFFKIPYVYAVLIGSFVIIIYSSFGGILSVTFTDVIQIFTFGIFIPIFAFFLWTIFDSSKEIITTTLSLNHLFDYKQVFDYHNMNFYVSLVLFIYFTLPALDPVTFQRILMARSTMQVRQSFIYSAILCLLIGGMACFVGIIALSYNPNIDPNNLMIYVIDHHSFAGLKGFMLIAIMAMGMSTADSYINASAVIFSNDFCRPLGIKFIQNDLLLARLSSFFIGTTAILLVLFSDNLFKLLLLAGNFYTPIITVPLMMAIFGFRSTPRSVLAGMACGLTVVIVWRFYVQDQINIDSIIPGTIANLIGLLTFHYLFNEPGGWIGIKDPESLIAIKLERKRKFNQLILAIKDFNLIKFCKSNLPLEPKSFSVFGIFIIISTYSAMYMIPLDLRTNYKNLYDFIYHSVFILSCGFLTYPVWPSKFKHETFIAIAWNIGVFYMFVCVSMMLVIITEFDQMQLMILILNLMAIGILFRWKTALLMTIAGMLITPCFFKEYTHHSILISNLDDPQFKIIYFLLLFSGVLIAFLKPKQQHEEISKTLGCYLEEQNKKTQLELIRLSQCKEEFINRLDRQCIDVFLSTYNQIIALEKKLSNQPKKHKQTELIKIVDKLKVGANYLNEVIGIVKNKVKINPTKVNLEKFLYKVIDEHKKINRNHEVQVLINNKSHTKEIEIDQDAIKKVLLTCINHGCINSNSYNGTILITDTKIEYNLDLNNPLKIRRDSVELSIIFDVSPLKQKETNQIDEINFAENNKIIAAHYGKMHTTLNEDNNIIYSIVIPSQLKEIRPKKTGNPDYEFEKMKAINDLMNKRITELVHDIAKQLIKAGMDIGLITKITKLTPQEINSLEI